MAADCHAKALVYPKSSRLVTILSVHGLLTLVSYALAMERGIWLLAAFMVHKYGPEAPEYVERKLAEMQHQRDSKAHIAVWCQIRARRAGDHRANAGRTTQRALSGTAAL